MLSSSNLSLFGRGRRLQRFAALLLAGLSGGTAAALDPPPIVFVTRDLGPSDADGRSEGLLAVDHARSGKLMVLEPDGRVRTLVDGFRAGAPSETPADVMDPDVSYDATKVVFSGFASREGAFRIFEVGADGTGLRQITRSDRQVDLSRYGEAAPRLEGYDDLDPCYLPDGRICFVSTRYPEVAPDQRSRATNLYLVNADGSGLHRITTERFGADTPAVEPSTGRIVYSRWWRTAQVADGSAGERFAPPGSTVDQPPTPPPSAGNPPPVPPGSPAYGNTPPPPPSPTSQSSGPPETVVLTTPQEVLSTLPDDKFPGVNTWFLASIRPDGTSMSMYAGAGLDREQTQAYRPSFFPSGEVLALFIPQTPLLGRPGENGLRRFRAGAARPIALGGPQTFEKSALGTAVDESNLSYGSAAALPDGRLLVSAQVAGKGSPRDYDLFIKDGASASPVKLFGFSGTSELDATPLVARPLPPVLPDGEVGALPEEAPRSLSEAFEAGGSFTFLCENIHFNAQVDAPIPNAPPVGKRLAIEFYTSPQRQGTVAADPPILIQRIEIPNDGRIQAELPAGVPLFEVLRRPEGEIPVGRDGQIFHVGGLNFGSTGQANRCVGCHAGHSLIEVSQDIAWTNLAPSALVTATTALAIKDPDSGKQVVFRPEALVDRRTDRVVSEWAAGSEPQPQVELRWSVPIHAREVVLYGPRPGEGRFGARDQLLWSIQARTSRLGEKREERAYTSQIPTPTMRLALEPKLDFDLLTLTFLPQSTSGLFEGRPNPALAEVEVIGRVDAYTPPPQASFVRGDSNCDGEVNLSDAVSLLGSLFLGQGALCCGAAGDADSDGELSVSDAVYLLNFQFQGGPQPDAPFPGCGQGPEGNTACNRECI
jgi:hypothetical protein